MTDDDIPEWAVDAAIELIGMDWDDIDLHDDGSDPDPGGAAIAHMARIIARHHDEAEAEGDAT